MSAAEPELIINPRWIIPVVPHATVLENHSLLVADGRILDIVPTGAQHYPQARVLDLPGQALLPGLINMHTHAAMNLLRGVADDRPLMEWLEQHIWPLEARFANEHFCRIGVRHAIAEMLRGGITCFNDMYFFPEATAQEVAAAGIRAQIGMILVDFPTAYAQGADEYFEKGLALHDSYKGHARIRTAFAPHAPYTVGDEGLKRIRMLADQLDVPVHMHLHETAHEVNQAEADNDQRPLQRIAELDLLNDRLQAVHMTQLKPGEIQQLAAAGCHVVHCPESNLKLASGLCPVDALMQAGVNVTIGTDGAASNNDLDLFGEMRSAALIGKLAAGRADAVSAAEVLAMATINAARALDQEDAIGSLEPGKWADLCAVDLSGLDQQPLYDPISQLVYCSGRHQVSHVWVAGRCLLRDGELTSIDVDELGQQVEAYRVQIAGADRERD